MHHSYSLTKLVLFSSSTYLSSCFSISMSFTASPSIIRNSNSWPKNMVVCDMPHHACRDSSFFPNKGISKARRNLQNHLTVANVASPLHVTAPPPEKPPGTTGGRQHHVAWTSISQERWEGELLVQGHIPLWLVSASLFFFFK